MPPKQPSRRQQGEPARRLRGDSTYGARSIFAPGLNILSNWFGSPRTTKTASDTAQAAAHVADLAACLISSSKDITTADVGSAILVLATKGALVGHSHVRHSDLLAYNNATGSRPHHTARPGPGEATPRVPHRYGALQPLPTRPEEPVAPLLTT
ncbi:hypothetical protein [Streptomyces sp. NPDC003943]